jgi:Peptidase S24-like
VAEGEPRAGDGAGSADALARLVRARVEVEARWIDVSGSSMEPTIVAPASLLVVDGTTPRLGEVWLFVDDDERLLAHRFLRRAGARLRFQGDAERWPDRPVSADRLVGRVERVVDPRGERGLARRRAVALWRNVRFGVWRRTVIAQRRTGTQNHSEQ